MTWPLAMPGYWISGNNPAIFHDCQARPDACPGSPFANNASRINALRLSSSNHPSQDALKASCFRRSDTNDNVAHSGWQTLPHAGAQRRWNSPETVATVECWDVVGASCAVGYSGAQHNKACVDCDASYYPDSSQNKCSLCPKDSAWWLGVGVVVGSLILAPITIRFAGMAKHAGALTAPLMSLVNFLQSIDLFRQLQLQWPKEIKDLILKVASVFNLNINILGVHPECSLHLEYWQKWCLKMLSPVGVILSLLIAIFIRRSFARRIRNLKRVSTTVQRKASEFSMSLSGVERSRDLYLAGGRWHLDSSTIPDGGVSRAASPALPLGGVSRAASPTPDEPEPEPSPALGNATDAARVTTIENSLLDRSSSRQPMPRTQEPGAQGRSACARVGFTLLGFLFGTVVGWVLTAASLKSGFASGTAGALLAYYVVSKKPKPHKHHEVSSGEEDADATPASCPPPFLFGDRQFAALREGNEKPQCIVFNVHSRSDKEDVISIGLFESFDIEHSARYEVTVTVDHVAVSKYSAGSDEAIVEVRVAGALLKTHDDPWVWIEVQDGEIHIGSSPSPPPQNEGRPPGAESLITCVDENSALRPTHFAIRSWFVDDQTLTTDATRYCPSKNDWIVDIPGEPASSWFRADGWAEFNQAAFEARSIYVFLVFMMVS